MMGAAFDRRLTPARSDLAAAHLRGQVAAQRFVEGRRHAVIVPAAPLRPSPRPDIGIDTELLRGETVTVYDRDGEGWCWVQADSDGYVGWLPDVALGACDPPAATHRITALRSFLFPEATIKAPPLAALPFGARVTAAAQEGAFLRLADGYLWAGHLAPVETLDDDPVAVAERFLGTPYLWGGKTSLGLDCSALVQTALGACGIAAPRDSDLQERALGTAVDPDAGLRRGDLVFWRGHVGMMCDPARMLHANGHTMTVAVEDFGAARRRIEDAGGGAVTRARRLTQPCRL